MSMEAECDDHLKMQRGSATDCIPSAMRDSHGASALLLSYSSIELPSANSGARCLPPGIAEKIFSIQPTQIFSQQNSDFQYKTKILPFQFLIIILLQRVKVHP